MEIKINLPKLGESIHHATIVQWLKNEGDAVEKDEALVEVATDKVNSEIPSTAKGVVKKILCEAGKEVEIGELIAIIETERGSYCSCVEEEICEKKGESASGGDFFSPAVLKLCQTHGISMEEAGKIPKENAQGRLSKKDVEQYLEKRKEAPKKSIPMGSMRKAIAENMMRSSKEIPAASLITKVNVTSLVQWMGLHKQRILQETGVRISITAFALHALAESLKEFPLVNASLSGDEAVFHSEAHIGVAVHVEGGLVVPIIRSCQKKSVLECAKELQEVALLAREGKLSLDQMMGGTITLTNFGMTGIQMGFPIIRFPEVAILGLGAIHKEVVVHPDDSTSIGSMLYFSLSFDHRLFDGIYACHFLRKLQMYLETKRPEDLI
jgi:2-oxoglutarate dehydrogenase E2 component (dihydrolipoamide succinyltransferase)